jgi:hypothetical protein
MPNGTAIGPIDAGTGRGRRAAPGFPVGLALRYYVQTTGARGAGVTREASRSSVVFEPSGSATHVGDSLLYVMMFPRHTHALGAVAFCRGRVVKVDANGVTVTIDEHRFQPVTTTRPVRRHARRSWLVGLCCEKPNELLEC